MNIKPIKNIDSEDYKIIKAIYERTFPENERKNPKLLMQDPSGVSEVYGIYEEGIIGLICTFDAADISHLIYFSVAEEMRNKGRGSEALRLLQQMKKGKRLIADIERPDESAENNYERISRKNFYLRNGFAETEIKYEWRGEKYEIIGCGRTVSGQEFDAFWDRVSDANRQLLE